MILVAAKRLWGHSKNMFILHAGCLWIFEWKIEEWKERKELFFCKLNIKDGNIFYTGSLLKKGQLEEMEEVNDNAGAFMHLNIKANR